MLNALRLVFATLSATFGAAFVLSLLGAGPAPRPADLVLLNGKIVTLEDAEPEVRALAARGDSIVALGSDADIRRLIGPRTRVIDLAGRLAIPGFIESHGHFMGLGASLRILRLAGVASWDEIVERVAAAAKTAKPGEWITGRGWHQEKWTHAPTPNVEGFPTHQALSRAAPRNPVFLTHASGHASIANAEALRLAGITRATPDPPGGEILHDASGEPTGLLRETASELVRGALDRSLALRTAPRVEADAERDIALATLECLKKGVTSFQDAGSSFETIARFERLARRGKLGLRLWVMVRESNQRLTNELTRHLRFEPVAGRLTVRAIKKTLDGALGSRGAWLLEPYTDSPASTGLNTIPVEELRETAAIASRAGVQLCVHAIGDRANREALDVYEATFRQHPERGDWRWRIEHAQHLSSQDIPRFGSLGVIASIQGVHCTSDGPWVLARLGEARAAEGAYVWRTLRESGALLVNGTDAPVEDVSPIACFHSSVTRRVRDGTTFFGDQRMTREEALRTYTRDAARAAFEERIKGTLAVGKLADIAVLSRDILTVPDDQIPGAQVDFTVVGGRVGYARERTAPKR